MQVHAHFTLAKCKYMSFMQTLCICIHNNSDARYATLTCNGQTEIGLTAVELGKQKRMITTKYTR